MDLPRRFPWQEEPIPRPFFMPTEEASHQQWNELILRLVLERRKAEHEFIEKLCEQAVCTGVHGVLVARDRIGTLLGGRVSEDVPYGNIYEMVLDV